VIFVSQWLANPAARLGREIRVSDRHRQLRVLASSSVRSPDTTENGARSANRSKKGKVICRKIDNVRVNPVAATWGDNPKIRSYIEIVELSDRAPNAPLRPQKLSA